MFYFLTDSGLVMLVALLYATGYTYHYGNNWDASCIEEEYCDKIAILICIYALLL